MELFWFKNLLGTFRIALPNCVEVDPAVDCVVQCHLRKLIAECSSYFSAHGAKPFLVVNFRDCLSYSCIQLLIVSWCHLKEVDSRSVPVHNSHSVHYPVSANLVPSFLKVLPKLFSRCDHVEMFYI